MKLTLKDQPVGYEGILVGHQGPEILQARLMELGFIRGESLKIEAKTPFRDLIIAVRGTEICLRPEEAECLLV